MSRIPATPDFDPRIADWLEADPDEAPGTVLDTVLAALPSIPQRRASRVPWRLQHMNRFALLGAAAAMVIVVGLGGLLLASRPQGPDVGTVPGPSPTTPPSPAVSPSATPAPSATARADWSDMGGRILVEHLGNAIDSSESATDNYHPERRRLYWMDPATMNGDTAEELLPGQPPSGKLDADVSADGSRIVFMDTADPARLWIANADGSGLTALSDACTCSDLDPAFDPTGTKVVFVRLQGASRASRFGANQGIEWDEASDVTSWLGIRDLRTGEVTRLDGTTQVGADGLPYQPSWSPDGNEIVFNRITWETGGDPTSVLQVVDVATGEVRTLETLPDATTPGDADWSPDGSTIVFTDHPWSSMGSIAGLPSPFIYTIRPDGTGLTRLRGGAGASWMADGRILYQANTLWVMNADGSGALPVNRFGMDLSELAHGFVYISHWVAP